MAEAFGDIPERLPEWFGPEGKAKDMVCVSRREYDVECNWKFVMENTVETYHTTVVHKSSLGPMRSWPMEPHRGDWDAVTPMTSEMLVCPAPTPPAKGSFAFVGLPFVSFRSLFVIFLLKTEPYNRFLGV